MPVVCCRRSSVGLVTTVVFASLCLTGSDVVQITSQNIDSFLANTELAFINFYADWCRFSQILTPIFEESERKVKEAFPEEGKVVFGKVNCDTEAALASVYRVGKYPTLKVIRYGISGKKEYRGQRSVEAIVRFVKDQLASPVSVITNLDDLDNLDWQKAHLIGYYDSDRSNDYKTFLRVASVLRHDCQFHAATGPLTAKERIAGNKVVFRPSVEPDNEMTYSGSTGDFSLLLRWSTDKCVPLVRELTFENAEEFAEEGLPFLLLFYQPNDLLTPQKFKNRIAVELLPERNSINFLTADGNKFTHPLQHLGKTTADLPVIVIDSFKHMYIWSHDPKTGLETPGLLKQFVADLNSGKLHQDFHAEPNWIKLPETKPEIGAGEGNGTVDENTADETDDDEGHAAHFDVQQQLIIDSSGIRVQVMRVIKLGHSNEPMDLSEHLSNLFNSLTDLSFGFDELEKQSDDVRKNNEDKFTNDFDDSSDQFWMKLVEDDDDAGEQEDGKDAARGHHHHSDSETTTTVMKASHKLKVPTKEKINYPPNSIFAKLAPSKDRYTILRDEL